ncbi:MAG: PAS domain S-box protein [Burkholderiaceae bacterium]|nr:PAS domain S-box protein [Burkholderiaceae bacterium]
MTAPRRGPEAPNVHGTWRHAGDAPSAAPLDRAETERLMHELSVHQIELETQNEQLRQAQTALEQSRDRYADFFERAPVAFVAFGSGDVIVEVNRLACTMLDQTAGQLIGRRFQDFLAPSERVRFRRSQGRLLRLEGPQTLEVQLAPEIRTARWVSLEMALSPDTGGAMQCRTAMIDLTERMRTQADMAWLAAIVSASDDAIIGRDPAGSITSWNEAATRMFGLPAGDMLGSTMDALVPDQCRAEEARMLRALRAGERITQFETERLTAGGATVPLAITLSPVRNAAGHLIGSAMIARDISERVRSDAALRRRLRQLDALSHAGQALILGKHDPSLLQQELFERVADAVGSEVQLNYALTGDHQALVLQSAQGLGSELLESMRSAPLDHSLCGIVVEQRRPVVLNHLHASELPQARSLQQAGVLCFAGFPLIARGHVYGVAAFASTSREHFREGDLQVMQTVCDQASAMHERTQLLDELHAREQSLKRADRAKDEFIATLAHELRNPLAPIRNAVGIMRHEDQHVTQQLAWCRDVIDRQVVQMTRLLEDLLDVSRVTRNKIELRRDRIDLLSAVEQALEATRPLIEAQGQRLQLDVPPGPMFLYGDLTRLTQVFGNLMNNAAKYTDPGGLIKLTVTPQERSVRVSVRDSGIGIEAQQLPRVFDMFSQLEPALERARGGLGIGLALTRGLVEQHGGTIEAFSAGAGQGSEFVVRLPLTPQLRAREDAMPNSTTITDTHPKRRVLVVDDNVDAAQTLAAILEMLGHDVRVAYSGAEGLRIATEWKPDVGVLDIGIPDLNGYELARGIRERCREHQPLLIACTGWGQQDDVEHAQEAGFDHHLVKPVDPDAVLRLLQESPPRSD